MNALEWMAWTGPTAAFFGVIALLVLIVSLSQRQTPRPARRGWLPMATTPGDRLFVSLLAAAFVHVGWLLAAPASLPVWPALAIAVALGIALMRYG